MSERQPQIRCDAEPSRSTTSATNARETMPSNDARSHPGATSNKAQVPDPQPDPHPTKTAS